MSDKLRNTTDPETFSRRTILAATGAMSGLVVAGSTAAVGQTDQELDLSVTVHAEDEFISITNNADEAADLTGYSINFDAEGGNDQIQKLAGEVVIEPGSSIIVPTGARDVSGEGVVELEEPYEGEVLNNDGSDIVEVLDEDLSPVASSDPANDDGGDDDLYDGSGVIRVVNQDGEPVKGEIVWIASPGTVEDYARDVGYTDAENGEITVQISGLEQEDVTNFTVEVRGEEQDLSIMSDEHTGVQEVVFEVDSIGAEGNPTVVTAIDSETKEPVEGAAVDLDEEGGDPEENESFNFETDEFGRVEEQLDIGSYIASVSKGGYEDAHKDPVSLENYFHAELEPTDSEEDEGEDKDEDEDESEEPDEKETENGEMDKNEDKDKDKAKGEIGGDDPEPSDDSEQLENADKVSDSESDSGTDSCPTN